MSFLSGIFGSAAGKAIAEPIEAIGNAFDKIFTSDEERLKAAAVMEKLKQHPAELQVEINKLEAQSTNWFNSGWRPYIGWICGTCIALYFIPQFIIGSYLWAKISLSTGVLVAYPVNASSLFDLVLAMLGMAGLRTFEKATKITK